MSSIISSNLVRKRKFTILRTEKKMEGSERDNRRYLKEEHSIQKKQLVQRPWGEVYWQDKKSGWLDLSWTRVSKEESTVEEELREGQVQ